MKNQFAINPSFSGYFFLRTSNFNLIKIRKEHGVPVDVEPAPMGGFGIQSEPEQDEFVKKAIESAPNTKLRSYKKEGLVDKNMTLKTWTDAQHSLDVDAVLVGSFEDLF